jgi:hypothetical protein
MVIDRSAAVPQSGVAADGLVNETFGPRHGLAEAANPAARPAVTAAEYVQPVP